MLLADDRSRHAQPGAGEALGDLRLACDTPLGFVTLVEQAGALVALDWGASPAGKPSALLESAREQLAFYFAGRLRDFDLPLAPSGAPDDKRVWQLMAKIPWGKTQSYGQLASALGLSPRHVGQACGHNPIPIIIPCHRVISSTGALTGYSGKGGIETKRKLLQLESALLL
jgi:methylated-DNA-[protein]-cysteine S-methyltransferase